MQFLGLSFKPDTDDIREAVSIPLIKQLLNEGAIVTVYDPAAMNNARSILDDSVEYASTPLTCIEGSDCCVLVTEWNEFKKLQPSDFVEKLRRPFVIDGRRIYDATPFSSCRHTIPRNWTRPCRTRERVREASVLGLNEVPVQSIVRSMHAPDSER